MRLILTIFPLAVVAFLPLVSETGAENNWPNWRGPNFNGSLEGVSPPREWSDTDNVKWKVRVPGRGSGSPIVWEDQIILLTAVETPQPPEKASQTTSDDNDNRPAGRGRGGRRGRRPPPTEHEFVVISFHLGDGQVRWQKVVNKSIPHEGGHGTNTFASSSAVTDGRHIYASFGSRGIYCLTMDGELVWSKELGKMQTRNAFGEGSSPTLVGDTLIVPWDHEGQSSVFALEKATGEVRWKTDRDERTTWATPSAIEHANRIQIVMNGTTVRSYDLATGELLWSCGGQVSNPIPCPVRIGDSVVCMTGYRGNAIYAMPLDAKGDISDSDQILWQSNDAAPYVSSPALYKGSLYFTKERTGVMSSLAAMSGEVLIAPTRLSKIRDVYASPVAAGDMIYFTSRDGITTVIRHAKELEEIAVNDLGEPVDASPAIVGNQLLIRGAEHLYCIGE